MLVYENECRGCAVPSYPCRGESCAYRNVPHFYCDRCGKEKKLYVFEDEEFCIDCIEKMLDVVEGSER